MAPILREKWGSISLLFLRHLGRIIYCSLVSFLGNAFTLVTHWGVKEGFTLQYEKIFDGAAGFDALLVFLFANRAAYASRIPLSWLFDQYGLILVFSIGGRNVPIVLI